MKRVMKRTDAVLMRNNAIFEQKNFNSSRSIEISFLEQSFFINTVYYLHLHSIKIASVRLTRRSMRRPAFGGIKILSYTKFESMNSSNK